MTHAGWLNKSDAVAYLWVYIPDYKDVIRSSAPRIVWDGHQQAYSASIEVVARLTAFLRFLQEYI